MAKRFQHVNMVSIRFEENSAPTLRHVNHGNIRMSYQLMQDFLHSIIAFPRFNGHLRFTASWIRFFWHGIKLRKPREGLKVFGKLSLGGGSTFSEDANDNEGWFFANNFPATRGSLRTKLLPLSHDCMMGIRGKVVGWIWQTIGVWNQPTHCKRWKTWPKLPAFWWSWIPSFFSTTSCLPFFWESIVDSEIWRPSWKLSLQSWIGSSWRIITTKRWKSPLEKTAEILPWFSNLNIHDDAEWFQEELKRKKDTKHSRAKWSQRTLWLHDTWIF